MSRPPKYQDPVTLTLSMEKVTRHRAKTLSKTRRQSISEIFSNYIDSVDASETEEISLEIKLPLAEFEQLSGLAKTKGLTTEGLLQSATRAVIKANITG